MAIARINHPRMFGSAVIPTIGGGIEDASEAWVEGGVLVAHANGDIEEAGNGAITAILGLALHDATGVTGDPVEFIPALPGLIFEATLDDQSSSPHTSVQGDLYGLYGIYQEAATGFFYIDVNTANSVVVIRFVDPVGTVQARVDCMFLPSATAFDLRDDGD